MSEFSVRAMAALAPALTERQRDQKWVEQQRAENLRRADGSSPDAPVDPEWAGMKL